MRRSLRARPDSRRPSRAGMPSRAGWDSPGRLPFGGTVDVSVSWADSGGSERATADVTYTETHSSVG